MSEIKSSLINDEDFKYVKDSIINISKIDNEQDFRVDLIEYINDSSSDNDDAFFFNMLEFVRFLDPNDDAIAFTTPDKRIFLNSPGDKVGKKVRVWEFIYDHECLHQLWDTFGVGEKIQNEGKEYNHTILNIASDCVINDYLRFYRKKEPFSDGVFPEYLQEKFGITYDRKTDTQYSLYMKLMEKKEEIQKDEKLMKEIEDMNKKLTPKSVNKQSGPTPPPPPSGKHSEDYKRGWTDAIKDVLDNKIDPLKDTPNPKGNGEYSKGYNDAISQMKEGLEKGINISDNSSSGGAGGGDLPDIPWDLPQQNGGQSSQKDSKTAEDAQENADEAQDAANEAKDAADKAQKEADDAAKNGDSDAKEKQQKAKESAKNAKEAQNQANKAQAAADKAKDAKNSGNSKKEEAEAKKSQDAAEKAKEAANKAKGQSGDSSQNDAKTAEDAQDAADKAQDAADKAKAAAQEAQKNGDPDAKEKQEAAEDAQDAADKAQNAADKAKEAQEAGDKKGEKDAAQEAQKASQDAQNASNKAQGKDSQSSNQQNNNKPNWGHGGGSLVTSEEDLEAIKNKAEAIIEQYKKKISGVFGEFIKKCKSSYNTEKTGLVAQAIKANKGWNLQMNQIINTYVKKVVFQKKREFKKTYQRVRRGSGPIKFGTPINPGKKIRKDNFDITVAFYIDKSGSMGGCIDNVFKAAYVICEALKKHFKREDVVNDIEFKMFAFDDDLYKIKFGQKSQASGGTMSFHKLLSHINKETKDYLINIIITDAGFEVNETEIEKFLKELDGIVLFIENTGSQEVKRIAEKLENKTKLFYIKADSNFTIQ